MRRLIHIPKTGGQAVVAFCRQHDIPLLYGLPKHGGSSTVRKHSTYQHWKNEDSQKFAIVRNPLTRLVSWFRYLSSLAAYNCDFTEFVHERLEPSSQGFKTPSPWQQQKTWVQDGDDLGDVQLFQFETMQHTLLPWLGCPGSLPKINVTNHDDQDLESWYDSRTRNIVEQHFRDDIQLWRKVAHSVS